MISELCAGVPISVAGITLIPIERVRIYSEKQAKGYWLTGTKEAVAVMICEREGARIIDLEAHEHSVDEFITQVPELESLLIKCPPP
jgi:uncharacterized spore protein YtfJ